MKVDTDTSETHHSSASPTPHDIAHPTHWISHPPNPTLVGMVDAKNPTHVFNLVVIRSNSTMEQVHNADDGIRLSL